MDCPHFSCRCATMSQHNRPNTMPNCRRPNTRNRVHFVCVTSNKHISCLLQNSSKDKRIRSVSFRFFSTHLLLSGTESRSLFHFERFLCANATAPARMRCCFAHRCRWWYEFYSHSLSRSVCCEPEIEFYGKSIKIRAVNRMQLETHSVPIFSVSSLFPFIWLVPHKIGRSADSMVCYRCACAGQRTLFECLDECVMYSSDECIVHVTLLSSSSPWWIERGVLCARYAPAATWFTVLRKLMRLLMRSP